MTDQDWIAYLHRETERYEDEQRYLRRTQGEEYRDPMTAPNPRQLTAAEAGIADLCPLCGEETDAPEVMAFRVCSDCQAEHFTEIAP